MVEETVLRATQIIGEITIQLKKLGIVPAMALAHKVNDGIVIFIVTLTYQEGFARRRYQVVREAIEAPEFAYQYAIEDFWQMVLEDMGRRESVDDKK